MRNDRISEDLLKENSKLKVEVAQLGEENTSLKGQLEEKSQYCTFLKDFINQNVDIALKEKLVAENQELKEKNQYLENRERELIRKLQQGSEGERRLREN